MGHERVGHLPRTRRWISIVGGLDGASNDPRLTVALANATLKNVRDRLDKIERDAGVTAALEYLIALSHTSHSTSNDQPSIPDLSANPSPARLALALCRWVDANQDSPEYAEIAKQAASDAISSWSVPRSPQEDLFSREIDIQQRWHQAANGAGFSEVARLFFARFTERYLRYFLDREASASLPSLQARERFEVNLKNQVDIISRHAFETSKITQSFAAGWYNRYARQEPPSRKQLKGFLRLAFHKIREELAREATPQ